MNKLLGRGSRAWPHGSALVWYMRLGASTQAGALRHWCVRHGGARKGTRSQAGCQNE